MPSLIVTVDTEEEGLWGRRYLRTGNTVENIRHVPRFQALCDRYGIRPTYLVDAPVIQQPWAVDILRKIQDDDRCEIGAHCHPWCNPPFEEEITPRNSYLCNLPEPLQRSKLTWLTERIEERFNRRPTSFRAGRYGLDITGARILADLGYKVDSSVIPFTDYSHEGGPNFLDAPDAPYWIDLNGDSLAAPTVNCQLSTVNRRHSTIDSPGTTGSPAPDARSLLEIPVTVGFNRVNFERAHRVQQFTRRHLRPFRVEGILDRLGLLHRIKLSPEQSTAAEMKTLIDVLLRRNSPCLVLMLHSSSLMPGGSPYVRTPAELESFYGVLQAVFAHCVAQRELRTESLSRTCEETNPKATIGSV